MEYWSIGVTGNANQQKLIVSHPLPLVARAAEKSRERFDRINRIDRIGEFLLKTHTRRLRLLTQAHSILLRAMSAVEW